MCAQCLPHCPTWRLARVESESPRGRIALMQALHRGEIAAEGSTLTHLDQCLGCRRCEAVCPADVPYGELYDATQRGLRGVRRSRGVLRRGLRWFAARPDPFGGLAGRLLRAWAGSGLRRLLAPLLPHRLRRIERLLPRQAPPPPAPGRHGTGTPVTLFLGCIARVSDGETLQACVQALTQAGCEVRIPAGQGCCGALHLHAGDEQAARELAQRNLAAFTGSEPVITAASGCAATLLDYARIGGTTGSAFAARVTDVMQFLESRGAAPATAGPDTALHTPCTLQAVQRADNAPGAMLAGVRALPAQGRCCGAAGEYLLTQPRIADTLRDETLDELGDTDVLCTSNPGCAMHLRAGLAGRKLDVRVTHPVIEWLRCT